MKGRLSSLFNRVTAVNTTGSSPVPAKTTEEWLEAVEDDHRSALLSMYNGLPQRGSDGQLHEIDRLTRISPEQGMWMHDLALSLKPASILEVGMAYGYSSLYFLAALKRNGSGTLTSIDPFQHGRWSGIGAAHAAALAPPSAAAGPSFFLVEDRSDRAIVDLIRAGYKYDIVFIDGNHRFDDVLVDFYLSDQVCPIGGHIILDDMWMSSVRTVVAFIRSNRDDFVEVQCPVGNVVVFRKVKEDGRSWDHFHAFPVAAPGA